jgi:uncharacterized repeat protein (TIGR02543 family)
MNKLIKLLKTLFLSIILIASISISLTSCSFGLDEDETLEISKISANSLENGDIEIVITYTSDDQTPLTFIIPKGEDGEQGKEGNGIKEITIEENDKGQKVLTIYFTDETMEPVTQILKESTSISSIETYVDSETSLTYMLVNYSDGTQSDPLPIPNGEDGNSITGIDKEIRNDFSVKLTIHFSQTDDVEIIIPAPEKGDTGEDGRGITSIVSIPSGDSYILTITYSTGESEDFEFARPNKWFSELSSPTTDDGINGDLWFNLSSSTIYYKENGKWISVIDLASNTQVTYTVKFDAMGGDLPTGSQLEYEVVSGTYFTNNGYSIPIPTKNGYNFIGWYTTKVVSPTSGLFTDLTPIFGDLVLYAAWEEVA